MVFACRGQFELGENTIVNGHTFVVANLRRRESWTLDVGSAMLPGNQNTTILRGDGPLGAQAYVLIWDGRALLPAKPGLFAPPRVHVTHLAESAPNPNPNDHEDELINWSGGRDPEESNTARPAMQLVPGP